MKFQSALIISFLVVALAVAGCAPAERRTEPREVKVAENTGPDVIVKLTYYDVQGSSAMEIRRDLYARSPIVADGEPRDARTVWRVTWNIDWTEAKTGCRVNRVTTSTEIAYLLPQLRNRVALSAGLLAEWDDYMAALLAHESRHQQFAVDAARRIESTLPGLGEHDTCDAAAVEAERIAGNVIQSAQRRERQYDYTTQHGYATGAEFPLSPKEN